MSWGFLKADVGVLISELSVAAAVVVSDTAMIVRMSLPLLCHPSCVHQTCLIAFPSCGCWLSSDLELLHTFPALVSRMKTEDTGAPEWDPPDQGRVSQSPTCANAADRVHCRFLDGQHSIPKLRWDVAA